MATEPYESQSESAKTYVALGGSEGKLEGRLEGEAEGERRGNLEGEAEGERRAKVETIVAVLRVRGLEPSETMLRTVRSCTDLEQLDAWHRAAVVAERVEDVFD